jgi:hypothetical protein
MAVPLPTINPSECKVYASPSRVSTVSTCPSMRVRVPKSVDGCVLGSLVMVRRGWSERAVLVEEVVSAILLPGFCLGVAVLLGSTFTLGKVGFTTASTVCNAVGGSIMPKIPLTQLLHCGFRLQKALGYTSPGRYAAWVIV